MWWAGEEKGARKSSNLQDWKHVPHASMCVKDEAAGETGSTGGLGFNLY